LATASRPRCDPVRSARSPLPDRAPQKRARARRSLFHGGEERWSSARLDHGEEAPGRITAVACEWIHAIRPAGRPNETDSRHRNCAPRRGHRDACLARHLVHTAGAGRPTRAPAGHDRGAEDAPAVACGRCRGGRSGRHPDRHGRPTGLGLLFRLGFETKRRQHKRLERHIVGDRGFEEQHVALAGRGGRR